MVDLIYHEAHRTMMKLHNIVILTTFNADMFQGYQILFIKARGDDIIIHKPTKYKIINITIINTNYKNPLVFYSLIVDFESEQTAAVK